jgi:hypothetical protein
MRNPLLAALMATALATSLATSAAAAEDWRNYDYPDAGFAVHFPAAPRAVEVAYTTLSGAKVPARAWSARLENVVYTVTVADFSRNEAGQKNAIEDAVKLAGQGGEVKVDVEARINRQYGRELSIVTPEGVRAVMAIFFFGGRLYQLDGRASGPGADGASARLIRFQQSLQFIEP